MVCSREKGSASCGQWGVNGNALKEGNLLEPTETGFLSSFLEC